MMKSKKQELDKLYIEFAKKIIQFNDLEKEFVQRLQADKTELIRLNELIRQREQSDEKDT